MANLNKVMLIGRLTRDPESKAFEGGKVVNFGFAVNNKKRNPQSGVWEDQPVWIECKELGLSMPQVVEALGTFRGVRRRQELRGELGGVIVIDDFAHHPTAVRATIEAARARWKGRRLSPITARRRAYSCAGSSRMRSGDGRPSRRISLPDRSTISATTRLSSAYTWPNG